VDTLQTSFHLSRGIELLIVRRILSLHLLLVSCALLAQSSTGKTNQTCNWSFPDVVACFNARGNGVTNDTAALRAAFVYGEAHNVPVHVRALTFSIVPADNFQNEGRTHYKGAFPIASNLHIEAEPGATFRIANGVSTSAAPVPMAMFYANGVYSNITIRNLTMDMNGANNRISYSGVPVTVTALSCTGATCRAMANNSWVYEADSTIYQAVRFWGMTSRLGQNLSAKFYRITSVSPTSFTFASTLTGTGAETAGQAEEATRLNQPQIFVTGSVNGPGQLPDAALSSVLLENDTFANTPGQSCIVMGQSTRAMAGLGTGWKLINNTFSNNGYDTDDHSSVYGRANSVYVSGNKFLNSNQLAPGLNGYTGAPSYAGPNTAYEIHGSGQTFVGNTVSLYYRGLWISDNGTSVSQGIVIQGNIFDREFIGADTYHEIHGALGIQDVLFENNYIYFDDTVLPADPAVIQKIAINIQPAYGVSNFKILGNHASKAGGTAIATWFADLAAPRLAGETTTGITISNNTGTGLANGVTIVAHNGRLENVAAIDNDWRDLTAAGTVARSSGYFVRSLGASGGTISGLTLGGGSVVDSRSSPRTTYGVYILGSSPNLTITDLTLKPTRFSGIVGANYQEAGSPNIQGRHGVALR
jgi:hypothetical protein